MKDITLVDQVMDSLAFEIEEVPQDGQISSAPRNSPLNVKIKIRKKNRNELRDGGIISIPKIDHPAYDNGKIRVTSSDQTITSFNVLMERGQPIKKRPLKQKKILHLFKRGGCLGTKNDEEKYEYSVGTSQHANKENELPEPIEDLSSDGVSKPNFTLAKNYSNTEVSQANKHKHKDFMGKCKPGGCLDPPFGEEKYSYLPKFVDIPVEDQIENKMKTDDCERKETITSNSKIKSKDEQKRDNSPSIKNVYSNTSSLQLKNSNSIITFPSITLSSEALNKLQIRKRSIGYSGSKESRGYNMSNQLLETYYISPKVKIADQGLKSITDSMDDFDTKATDISTLKIQEHLFGENKHATPINSELELNENLENAKKVALRLTKNEIIPDDILSNVTQGDKPVAKSITSISNSITSPFLFIEQENISAPITRMEKDGTTVINIVPETNPLNINEGISNPELLLNKQNCASNNEYLNKKDTLPETNLQEIPSKHLENIFTKNENDTETIIALLHDLTANKIDRTEINETTTDVPLNEIIQVISESLTKPVDNDDFKNKNSIEMGIATPQVLTYNNESLNINNVSTEIPPEEINQAIIKTLSKSMKSMVTKNTSSTEMMIAPHDLLYTNEDSYIKIKASMMSGSIEEQIKALTKPMESMVTKNTSSAEMMIAPHDLLYTNEDSYIKIKASMMSGSIEEQIKALTKPMESMVTKNTSSTEMMIAPHDLLYTNEDSYVKIEASMMSGSIEEQIKTKQIKALTKPMESMVTKNTSSSEKVIAPHNLLYANEDSYIKIEASMMSGSIEEQIKTKQIKALTKPMESMVTKNTSSAEMIIAPHDLLYTNEDSYIKNEASMMSSSIEEQIKTNQIKTLSKPMESMVTKNTSSTEMMIAPHDLFYTNEDSYIKNEASMMSGSIEVQKKDTSSIDIASSAKTIHDDVAKDENSIDKKFALPKKSSFSKEDLNTTEDAIMEVTSSTKNENNVEANVSLKDSSHDKEALKFMEPAANSHSWMAEMSLTSKSSQDKIGELFDQPNNKLEELVENNIKISTKSSAEIIPAEEIKSNTVDITKLRSFEESERNRYSDSVTNLNFQEIENSDAINTDQLAMQENQPTSITASVINSEEINELHVDVNSVDSTMKKLQEVEDQTKSNSGILQDEMYHKDLEVTFSNKIMSNRLEADKNILSEPTDRIRTIPNDDVSISNKEDKNLKHEPSRDHDENELIHINMAFQSFQSDKDGSVIKTLDFSSFSDSKRYPNDNILQFKTIIRPNDGEIKIPIDSDKDLVLQITTYQKYKDQQKQISSKYKSIKLNEGNNKGNLFPSSNSAEKDKRSLTVTKSILDGTKANDINLQRTLDEVYKDKLLPLHDVIKKLKNDIDGLTKQQIMIKEKIYNTRRVQSSRIHTTGTKCGCIEMLFGRY